MITVIAEWGQSHRGSLARAIEQAHATKDAGAHIAKWQIFDTDRLASRHATRYWDASLGGDVSQLETFRHNGMLSPKQWESLAAECDTIGVEFMATPFDLEAVDLLEDIGVGAFKIASGDITYRQLVEKVAASGKHVYLSTGASTLGEVERAIGWLDCAPLTLMACDLVYPCRPHEARLGRIRTLETLTRGPVGYSDHTECWTTGAYAVAAGATVLEKHCTLNADGGVPDDKMALTPDELWLYVDAAWHAAQMVLSDMHPSPAEQAARVGARRSIYAKHHLPAGHVVTESDVMFLRPCPDGAFAPADVPILVGNTLTVSVEEGDLVPRDAVASNAFAVAQETSPST